MHDIPFIYKKNRNSYLLWFQNSNQYLQLEEPAWFVFRKIIKRYKSETISDLFSIRYGIDPEESLTFVKEIRSGIEKLNQIDTDQINNDTYPVDLNSHQFKSNSTHYYRIGDNAIAFTYENRNFENYIHPLICHFETTDTITEMPLFELFAYQEQIAFRFNGTVKGLWKKDETQFVKGLIFMYLINVMHDKSDEDWLMTVHASAITNRKKTILFSAAPGNGKTTIAALLQTRGYQLVSDDFVPIDKKSFNAYPFPIAISVKQGSMDLLTPIYPSLEEKAINYISPEKSVRYFPPLNFNNVINFVFPVKEFIFIEYNKEVDFTLEKLDPVRSLTQLLDQAWVPPMKENAGQLIDQVMKKSFYKLTYSNNQKALDAVADLFEKD